MNYEKKIKKIDNACVVFGHFDFMHKGHQEVIKTMIQKAKSKNMKSVIISIVDTSRNNMITSEEEKMYHIRNMEVDEFITYECNGELDIKEFMETTIINTIGAKMIVSGIDENYNLIEEIANERNIEIIGCELVSHRGIVITTYDIMQAFRVCNFEKILKLCGHPYTMIGKVEHGKALGRTVGMPTANLGVAENKLRPPSGVYATSCHIENEIYKGLTNIGKRPSVDDENHITIETFLLDFDKDIYDKQIVIEVQLYIRGVEKFSNLEQVQRQVEKDLNKTRIFLEQIS